MIEFRNVSKKFILKKNSVQALDNTDLVIEDGDIFGIVGFSGAGKSTLLRMINGLEKPSAGEIVVDGKDLNRLDKKELRMLRKSIGMVFQQFNLLESKTVYDNVAMPLVLNKEDKAVISQRVKELLEFVELSDKIHAYPNQLSGGQKQRVGIARALATNPDVLLCDEATSALDPKTTDSILELLKKVSQDLKITIVIITHEMHVIEKICHKVAVMDQGTIIESGDVQQVFGRPEKDITKDFVDMIIQEELPSCVLDDLQYNPSEEQLWRIKYWGLNRTMEIMESLKKFFPDKVQIVYVTTNILQRHPLNILTVLIREEKEIYGDISKALRPFEVLLERR